MTSTQLYRHFDAADGLLYVGISLSAVGRLSQHKHGSHWSSDIKRVEIENFTSREEALAAETSAIHVEQPKHNVRKKYKPPPPAKKHAEEARAQLIREVTFRPLYKVSEAASFLGVSDGKVKALYESGALGSVKWDTRTRTSSKTGETTTHIIHRITGWQIIDYIESLEVEG